MIITPPQLLSFLHKIFCVVLILCGLLISSPAISAIVTIDLSTLGITTQNNRINKNAFDEGIDSRMYEKEGFLIFGDENNDGFPEVPHDEESVDRNIIYISPEQLGIGTPYGGVYYQADGVFFGTGVRFIVKKADGQEFDFQSVIVTELGGDTTSLFVEGFRDGVSVATQSIPFSINEQKVVALDNGFDDVDEVRFYSVIAFKYGEQFLFDKFVFEVASAGIPSITSATYDADTGLLSVTAENITSGDDIDVSNLTLTGNNGGLYALTSADVKASSATAFTVILNAEDKLAINGLLNKNGTSSTNATTYNLAAAANWNSTASAPEDLTGNGITVSNIAAPTITSAAYDSSTHTLTVTGTNFVSVLGANNDIDVSQLTMTGEGGFTYTLTSPDVEVLSQTSFSVPLNATDYDIIETIFNKNGSSSTSGTTYNLAAADDWNSDVTGADIEDLTNTLTVSNVPSPAISSATYDAISGVLVVSGTGLLKYAGGMNDINVAKFTISGDSSSYTLTSPDVEITSGTSFSITLNATDKSALISRLNQNGTSSVGATTYNFAAAEDWNLGADPSLSIEDVTGNPITVSNIVAPSAPTIGIATAGDAQASVTFTASASNGGSAITGYTVTASFGDITATGTSSPITVTGLTNGTTYSFSVTATNAAGTSSSSSASNEVTPQGSQTISFNHPGSQDFGTSPTLSATASSGLIPVFTSSTPSVCTITSGGAVTFVATGTCTINANQSGNAAYAAASEVTQSFAVNGVKPDAPTIGTATAGDGEATVTFSAPSNNGGASISSYTVTSNPGGLTATGTGSPLTVTGLTNGTTYTFSVTATNAAGESDSSSASNSVTPQGSQTISFNHPGSQDFGTSPTLSATASSGLIPVFTSTTTGVCTITSGGALTFVATGTCTINANQAGNAAYAAAPEVTQSFAVNGVAASAPTIGTATAGDGEATVTFSAPSNNGGASISSYTVTSNPGGLTATGTGSPLTVTGLTNGTTYTFSVTATNAAGTSSSSSASNEVTPQGSQTISFNHPGSQDFGTSPTLSATASSGLIPVFTSSTPSVCTITSGGAVTFVATGTCTINANQSGNAAYAAAPEVTQSFAVNGVKPDAPTIGTATAGDGEATVTFSAPSNNGGASISSYTVTSNPGGLTATGTGSPLTVTGLTNGTTYTFSVTATNAAGTSSSSSASNEVTPQGSQTISFNHPGSQDFGTSPTLSATASSGLIPVFTSSTPSVCTITSGGAVTFVATGTCTINANQSGNAAYAAAPEVTQSFAVNGVAASAPTIGTATAGDGEATVTFSAPSNNGGASISSYTVTSNPGGLTATGTGSPLTVTGLTNGTTYTFSVTATNAAGESDSSSASNSVTPQGSQTISFNHPGSQDFGTSPTLSATASSGLIPVFTSTTTGVCTITSGGALTFVATGTCTINANQSGNTAYAAAPEVTQSFAVNGVAASAPTIGTATAGDGEATVTFSAPSNNGGASISSYTVTSNPGGLTATGTGSPLTVTGLTNGTTYTFSVTATNAAGTSSSSSASNEVTPQGSQTISFNHPGSQDFGTSPTLSATASSGLIPVFTSSTPSVCTITSGGALTFVATGTCTINANQAGNAAYAAAPEVTQSFAVNGVAASAPTIGTATAGDGEATVTFSAPSNNGGASISSYTVTSNPGGLTATGTGSPLTVTGLTNGTTYTFSVTATNAAGTSSSSSASNEVTPQGSQTISFNHPGSQDFGTSPTLSATASSGLIPVFTSSTPSVCTITSGGAVTFVATGTCTINANQSGNAAYAAAPEVTQSFAVNGVAASAPTIGTATAGDGEATVTFSAPSNNGGASISSYTVTSNPGGLTATGTGSPLTVTGLTNGTTYTFSVTATNAAGTSSSSSASNEVTPQGSQTISFNHPGSQDFGTSPTLSATASSGLIPVFTSTTTGVCTITSGGALTFVATGTCTINANQSGNTAYAAAPEVTQSFAVNGVAASAPTIGTATAGDGEATVTFSAPSNNGGASISSYTVTSNPGGLTATGTGSPLTVTGLTNGTTYTFSVTATNAAGTSSSSSASNEVTPQGSQTISFNHPGSQDFGTSPTLSATASSGLIPVFTSSTPSVCTITSGGALTFVATGTCTINANQAGNAAYAAAPEVTQSFAVNGVAASAPTIGTATAGDGEATVTFSAPSNNGGASISSYTVTSNPGGLTATGTGSPLTVTGLTNGTTYTFSVTATNAAGTSSSSSASNEVTPQGSQTISFNHPGSQDFGTSPTLSATASSGLTPVFTSSTPSVCTITSGGALTFVATGTCTINANQAGNAAYAAAPEVTQSFAVNGVAASAPTIGTATAGDGEATVTFSAPSNNGGASISSYTVTSNPGGLTATGTGSPLTVTGLTNGTTYTFSVTATNAAGESDSSSASNDVTPNGAPVIISTPILNTEQNASYFYTLKAKDNIGDTLTYSAEKHPNWLIFNSVTGELTGVPKRENVGEHYIELRVTDEAGLYDTQTFTLTVVAVNSAPLASDAVITLEEDSSALISFTALDEDGDEVTFEIVEKPVYGILEQHGSMWLYTPDANFNGSDSVRFIAKDAEFSSNVGVISIRVTAINDAPEAIDDEYIMEVSESGYNFAVLDNDLDVDGDPLQIEGVATELGVVQIEGSLIKYLAPKGFVGPVAMRYSISDGHKSRSHARVQLLITGVSSSDAPVITVPPEVIANATGLKTKLNLGVATAVDKDGNQLSVSLINPDQLFSPGQHFAYWKATDSQGLTSIKAQKVTVNPLVSVISRDGILAEGNEAEISVLLNGEAPQYPLSIPFTLGGSADANDHDLVEGEFIIDTGLTASLVFNIIDEGAAESDEELIVSLAPTLNLAANNVARFKITDTNIAPNAKILVTQAGEARSQISKQDGKVYIDAQIYDLNAQDNLDEEWLLKPLVMETDEQGNYFEPHLFDEGSYIINLIVTDDGEPQLSTSVQMTLLLKDEFSSLTDNDSDGDLIPDIEEGFADNGGNGIPDYLEIANTCNVIQLNPPINGMTAILAESEPGTCLGLGNTAIREGNDGIEISLDAVPHDEEVIFLKGLFDFNITSLPSKGESVSVVLPQQLPLPTNAVYRKFNQGIWATFIENSNNLLSSSLGSLGNCPPPLSAEWQPGLTEGHWCVQLTIEDGGPNDADGLLNGTIVDLGGVAVMLNNNHAPIAIADAVIVPMNQYTDIDVLANDIDADDDPLSIKQVISQFGSVIVQDNQVITYIPADDFIGVDELFYTISDSNGGSSFTELVVTVVGNRAPFAIDDIASTDDKTVLILDVLSNDTDPDHQELTLIEASAEQGDVMIQNNLLHYSPKSGFEGVDIVNYTITDGEGGEATANVTINVKAFKTLVLDNGSGGGSVHWLWICLLIPILLVRHKLSMLVNFEFALLRRTWFTICSCFLVLLLGLNSSQAKEVASPWYLDVNISFNKADISKMDLQQRVTQGYINSFDNSDIGFGIHVGYRVNSLFTFEIGYLDLGEGEATIIGETIDSGKFHESMKTVSPVLPDGASIGARLTLTESQNWRFSLPLGVIFWESELYSDLQDESLTTELDGIDWYAGLRLDYKIFENWSMGLEFNYYAIAPNDILSYQFHFLYQF
ncbi:fibronectin type III domain-containing protein [Shewanella aestuarii]|uniref:Tandem-95 repeat protein n=1 Tax=Shewanella aestuarii TaxID=1028752 RepID=A0A6G9QLS2_9GAMM|nr:fibronectin type III domain-containing protein [Shewanella aestuarii]QIR15073.1 tandem-95 repeat protein [Shewanella aestuarii]